MLLLSSDDDEPAPASTSTSRPATVDADVDLEQQVVLALGPLTDQLLVIDRARDDESAYRDALAVAADAFTFAGDELARLGGVEVHPALPLYARATDLYRQYVTVTRVGLDLADPLGAEVDRGARRLRLLADRVYDRARIRLLGEEPAVPGLEVQRPDDVPDFAFEGLAPGAPLHQGEPARPTSSGAYEERPTSREAAWLAVVVESGVPVGDELSSAVLAADPAALAALADRFAAAEQVLRAAPDPEGQRERATLLRLTLLVYAEAARVGTAAALADGDAAAALGVSATALAEVGDALRDPALG